MNKKDIRKDNATMTTGAVLFGLLLGSAIATTCHYANGGRQQAPIEQTTGEVIDTNRFALWREADAYCGTDGRLTDTWCAIADPNVDEGEPDDSASEYPVGNFRSDDSLIADETYIRHDAPGHGYTFSPAAAKELWLRGCKVEQQDTDYFSFTYTSDEQITLD